MMHKTRKVLILIVSLLFIFISTFVISQSSTKNASTLDVLFVGSSNAEFRQCSCPKRPIGGFVRLGSYFEKYRKANKSSFALHCGDFFGKKSYKLKHQYTLKIMEKLGFDAISLGDQEFIEGDKFIFDNKGKIPLVTSNIKYNGKYIGQEYIIKNYNNKNIGIFSVIAPSAFTGIAKKNIKNIKIENYKTRSLEVVKTLQAKKVDMIVCLSHLGYDFDVVFAKEVPGIDLIIGGHSQTLLKKPERVNNTLIVNSGPKGERVGKVAYKIGENNKVAGFSYTMTPLTKDYKDSKDILSLVVKFEKDEWEKKKKK